MRDESNDGKRAPHPAARPKARRPPSTRDESDAETESPGEFDFINYVRRLSRKQHGRNRQSGEASPSSTASPSSLITHHSSLRPRPSSLVLGIGDDAAVIRQARATHDLLVTADLLVEDVDFRRAYAPPRLLGHKALAVSLSDIAAMGGRPRWALLSVGLPRGVWRTNFLEEFYAGFYALAGRCGVALVGGDVSRTPERVVVDSVVLGEVARGRALTREGARPGDRIFVTGTLGGAAAGLRLLESGARLTEKLARPVTAPAAGGQRARGPVRQARERLMLRQLRPEARVEWGAHLSEGRLASAAIDLSDGLSSDLAHLCRESGVGATVEASRLPLDPAIEQARLAFDVQAAPLSLALDGGEDFELLFTVPARHASRLPRELAGVPVTEIGEVTDDAGRVTLVRDGRARPLRPKGFTHFGGTRG